MAGLITEDQFLHPIETEKMRDGIRFHKWAEENDLAAKLGMSGGSYEVPFWQNFGDIIVTGRIDCIWGNVGIDFKTGSPSPEWLMESAQWKLYTMAFGLDEFRYVLVTDQTKPEASDIIKLYPYPGMMDDMYVLIDQYKFYIGRHHEKE